MLTLFDKILNIVYVFITSFTAAASTKKYFLQRLRFLGFKNFALLFLLYKYEKD